MPDRSDPPGSASSADSVGSPGNAGRLDAVFRALSEPARRAIIERLSLGEASVSDLAAPLAISLAAVVQHVQALEACGLVRTRKVGRVRTCELDGATLGLAETWLNERAGPRDVNRSRP